MRETTKTPLLSRKMQWGLLGATILLAAPIWGPITLTIALAIYFLAVTATFVPTPNDWSANIPAPLKAEVMCHFADGFGPGGDTAFALYALPPDVSKKIQGAGLSYFGIMPQPKFAIESKNPYGPWHAINMNTSFSCRNGKPSTDTSHQTKDFIAYRTISKNGEGTITVLPAQQLVIYLYE